MAGAHNIVSGEDTRCLLVGADRDGSAAQAEEEHQAAAAGPVAQAEAVAVGAGLAVAAGHQSLRGIYACGSGALGGQEGCWRGAVKEMLSPWRRWRPARRQTAEQHSGLG